MDVLTMQVYIWMFLVNLHNDKSITFPKILVDITKVFNDPAIKGHVILNGLTVAGFDTLTENLDNIQVTQAPDGEYDICVNVPIETLNFTTKYTADVGVEDKIPIYGEGMLSFSIKEIHINLCTYVNYIEGFVDNVDFRISYRHSHVELTGFMKNVYANEILSKILNIFNVILAMWNSYEPENVSCLTSPLVQYAGNVYLGYKNNALKFNTSCVWDSALAEILSLKEDLREDLVSWLKPYISNSKNYLLESTNKINSVINVLNFILGDKYF